MDDKKKKGIIFVLFYLVFFTMVIFLIINIRKENRNRYLNNKKNNTKISNNLNINIDKILSNNYKYSYNIIIDNDIYVYSGSRKGDIEEFYDNKYYYYKEGDKYYKNDGVKYIPFNNPNKYSYINDKIKDILNSSTLISEVKYNTGSKIYNMGITVDSLVKMFDNISSDLSLNNDLGTYVSDDNNNIVEISYDFTNYFKYKNICKNKFKVNFKYSNFSYSRINNPIR